EPVSLGQNTGNDRLAAYFNDGVIATQWVAKELKKEGSKTFEESVKTTDNPVRVHLGGEILRELTARLKTAKDSANAHVYAALFELNDEELEEALKDLGKRAHVVLANGSPQKNQKTGEITIDPNAEAREFLRNHHVDLYDRIFETATGGITSHLGHNKFAVFCEGSGNPKFVWTGSTNWSWSGLCTQTNNALIVNDEAVAKRYLDQWHLLADSKANYPPGGKKISEVPAPLSVGGAKVTVSFTPYTGKKGTITSTQPADLAQASKLIESAKSGILFLMFIPGPNGTLLEVIQKMNAEKGAKDLYVRGVVQQDPGPTAKVPSIALAHRGELVPAPFDIVYPEAVSTDMKWWVKELKKLSHTNAIIHSKVVVVDPMGDHPIVITGSHNLGTKASLQNDENLLIIENHPILATQYAVNIATVFNQYWWRFNRIPESQKKNAGAHDSEFHAKSEPAPGQLWKGLKHDDHWQHKYLPGGEQRFEIDFWMNRRPADSRMPAKPVRAGSRPAHRGAQPGM
ncbi:MAG TPA: phospholipase D-like domain-containing protein, partial [Terriglobales bacterium]|nr:phospholipase D-like domain-containing protein [Terriglobales bacterium]